MLASPATPRKQHELLLAVAATCEAERAPQKPGLSSSKKSIITIFIFLSTVIPPTPQIAGLKLGNERLGSAAANQQKLDVLSDHDQVTPYNS